MARTTRRASVTVDVAVVGGGLCGLALARSLAQRGRHVHVFEARTRLGGRIEAALSTRAARVDLGPSWYWPESQPLVSQLVHELGLRHFPQHDTSDVLVVSAAHSAAHLVKLGPVHSGARRLAGSMATLVEALAATLPAEQVHLGHVLNAACRRGQRVELHFLCDGQPKVVAAKRVVLALPPRLIAEHVRFEPALNSQLRSTLQQTPTWMANQAKVVLAFERAGWRAAGHSGNAFVQHDQATVNEIFDACEDPSELAALGAFVALAPATRKRLAAGLPLAIGREVAHVFGTAQRELHQLYRDWAAEAFTCSAQDALEYSTQPSHPAYGSPELRKARWDRRLYFGGTETAEIEGGYMEGALSAAERIARELLRLDHAETQAAGSSSIRTSKAVLPVRSYNHRYTEHLTCLQTRHLPALENHAPRSMSARTGQSGGQPLRRRPLLDTTHRLYRVASEPLQNAGPHELHTRRDAALAPRVHAAYTTCAYRRN